MAVVDANPLVLILKNFTRRVTIKTFTNAEPPVLANADSVVLQVQDLSDNVVYTDTFGAVGSRIVNPSAGIYYIVWGDPAAPENVPDQTETAQHCRFLFVWAVVDAPGAEEEQRVQTVEVLPARLLDCVREFRSQLDKGMKAASVDPEDFCPLGYTDGMLLEYLYGGMTLINAYQPYPTWCALEDFPQCFKQTLFDAGMIVGINSQTLFAIDSDIENWSDQGNAFVINHTPKLAAFNAALSQRLDKIIPMMKLHFVRSGSVKTEAGPNFRLNTLVQMSPNGATFRNVFSRS